MVAIAGKPPVPAPPIFKKLNDAKIEFQKRMIKDDAWQCCLNCEEWQVGGVSNDGTVTPTGCALHRAMPPPEIIVTGCNDHMMDIPF
jgi:hypothetical protein